MALKPQSIRKGIQILLNNSLVSKNKVIAMSEMWNENEITFFKKMLKQGGSFKIGNSRFQTIPKDKVLNSQGQKDGGIFKVPSIEDRF